MIAKNVNSFGNALIKKLIAEIVLERGVDRSMRGERRGFLLDRGLLGHGRRAAERRDELSPPDHSITSSARASSVGGISRPSALAAFMLMINSNLVA